jgi:hypothetical protein
VIERIGSVDVTYSWWLLAFFPCALTTIFVGWRLTLWLFPPEIESLENRKASAGAFSASRTRGRRCTPGDHPGAAGAALWLTDWLHGISRAKVAFGVG